MNAPQKPIFGDGSTLREWWFHSRRCGLTVELPNLRAALVALRSRLPEDGA